MEEFTTVFNIGSCSFHVTYQQSFPFFYLKKKCKYIPKSSTESTENQQFCLKQTTHPGLPGQSAVFDLFIPSWQPLVSYCSPPLLHYAWVVPLKKTLEEVLKATNQWMSYTGKGHCESWGTCVMICRETVIRYLHIWCGNMRKNPWSKNKSLLWKFWR